MHFRAEAITGGLPPVGGAPGLWPGQPAPASLLTAIPSLQMVECSLGIWSDLDSVLWSVPFASSCYHGCHSSCSVSALWSMENAIIFLKLDSFYFFSIVHFENFHRLPNDIQKHLEKKLAWLTFCCYFHLYYGKCQAYIKNNQAMRSWARCPRYSALTFTSTWRVCFPASLSSPSQVVIRAHLQLRLCSERHPLPKIANIPPPQPAKVNTIFLNIIEHLVSPSSQFLCKSFNLQMPF